jgi:hypothetical protein
LVRFGAQLNRVRSQDERITGLKFVSQVVPGPKGPLMWIDGGRTRLQVLMSVPDVIVANLRDAGVVTAEVTTSERGGVDVLQTIGMLGPCLTLRVFPDPPATEFGKYSPVPMEWLDHIWTWLLRQVGAVQSLTVRTIVPFVVELPAAKQVLDDALTARIGEFLILGGDRSARVSVVQGYFGWGQMACSTAFATTEPGELLRSADQLMQLGRGLASKSALAYLALEPHLGNQLTVYPYSSDDPMRGSLQSVALLADELLFDVFPWQILGPGHIRRLGQAPRGGLELPNGHWELGFGDLRDWLPHAPTRRAIRSWAGVQLAPCLLRGADVDAIARRRWRS